MRRVLIVLMLWIIAFFSVDYLIERTMLYGIKVFYGLNIHSDILLIGHSHLMLAIDKEMLEKGLGVTVSKYTREGVNVCDRKVMVKQVLESKYSDSLRLCLYGVDLCTFTGEGLSKNSYKLFYPFIDDKNVGLYIKSSTDTKDYWLHKIVRTSRYNDDVVKNASIRGWMRDWSNRKNDVMDIETYREKLKNGDERHIGMNPELIKDFEETVKMLTDREIRVILVNTPTLDLLNEYEPEKFQKIVQWFKDFSEKNDKVEYWDFNPEYSSRHDLFHDRLHLNVKGQEVITTEIIHKLNKYFQ